MNRAKNTDPSAVMIAQLQKKLDASSKKEQTLIEQNKLFQKRISVLGEVEKELSAEKTLRQQRERELKRFRKTDTENKKLTSEVQALRGEVAQLKGQNVSASKRLEKQEQLLKDKNAEQERIKEEVKRLEKQLSKYEEHLKKLPGYRDSEAKAKQRLAELSQDSEKQRQQNQAHLENITFLKRQIKEVESENTELKSAQTRMSGQMDQMRKNVVAQKREIESQKEGAMKQANLISELHSYALADDKVKQEFEKNVDQTMKRMKHQDQRIDAFKTEITNKNNEQTQMKIQITALKSERGLTLQNLSKAQREIGLLNTTIGNQQQEIQARSLGQKKMGTELEEVKKNYDSVSNQLMEAREKLGYTKVLQDKYKDNVQQDLKLEEDKYRVILTEREELERELQLCQLQASRQRDKITVQEGAKDSLAQTVKTLREEIKSLTLQNKELRAEHNRKIEEYKRLVRKLVSSKEGSKCVKQYCNSTFDLSEHRQEVQQERRVQSQGGLIEKQRKQIKELEVKLARRPDDAVQKLVKCQLENRELKQQVMALKGEKEMYKTSHKRVREENETLTKTVSKMKVEARSKGKAEHQGEPQVSRRTPVWLFAARTQSQTEDRSSRVPAATNTTQPRPPPPSARPSFWRLLTRRVQPLPATPVPGGGRAEERGVLVFANKQDLPRAMSVSDITKALGLSRVSQPWFVQASCAVSGSGLVEGLDWLSDEILKM